MRRRAKLTAAIGGDGGRRTAGGLLGLREASATARGASGRLGGGGGTGNWMAGALVAVITGGGARCSGRRRWELCGEGRVPFIGPGGGADMHGKLGTASGIRSSSATAGRRTPAASRTRARETRAEVGGGTDRRGPPASGTEREARRGGADMRGRPVSGTEQRARATARRRHLGPTGQRLGAKQAAGRGQTGRKVGWQPAKDFPGFSLN